MASAEGQALQIRPVSARVTAGDAIVILGAVVAILLGWAVKGYHDNRMTKADLTQQHISLKYPHGWIRLPVTAPELLRALSNDTGKETVVLTGRATTIKDVRHPQNGDQIAPPSALGGPAAGQIGFVQLSSQADTVDGNNAVRTDYAYVQTTVGGGTAPVVIKGRQEAWIKDGKLYVLALEGPEGQWGDVKSRFGAIVDSVST